MESVKRRVISLDVFRGLTIAGMIFVNLLAYYPETPALLKHAPWTGLTLADLVFPFLLFIVGVSMSYSLLHVPNNPPENFGGILSSGWLFFTS
jgi:predicted acyltransferase